MNQQDMEHAVARPARRGTEGGQDHPTVVELLESLESGAVADSEGGCWVCQDRGYCAMPSSASRGSQVTNKTGPSRLVPCPRCNRQRCLQEAGVTHEQARRSALADLRYASDRRAASMALRHQGGKEEQDV